MELCLELVGVHASSTMQLSVVFVHSGQNAAEKIGISGFTKMLERAILMLTTARSGLRTASPKLGRMLDFTIFPAFGGSWSKLAFHKNENGMGQPILVNPAGPVREKGQKTTKTCLCCLKYDVVTTR